MRPGITGYVTAPAVAVPGASIRAMPDIAIESITFDSLTDIALGGASMAIVNKGSSVLIPKTIVQAEIYVDSMLVVRQYIDLSGLNSGETRILRANLSYIKFGRYGRHMTPGVHKVSGKIDVTDKIKERNEKNNAYSADITITTGCQRMVLLKSRGSALATVDGKPYQLFPIAITPDSVRFQITSRQEAKTGYVNATRSDSFAALAGFPRMYVYTIVPSTQASIGVGCS